MIMTWHDVVNATLRSIICLEYKSIYWKVSNGWVTNFCSNKKKFDILPFNVYVYRHVFFLFSREIEIFNEYLEYWFITSIVCNIRYFPQQRLHCYSKKRVFWCSDKGSNSESVNAFTSGYLSFIHNPNTYFK